MNASVELPVDPVLGEVMDHLHPRRVLDACREQLDQGPSQQRRRWCHARAVEALYHPHRYVRVAYALLRDPSVPDHRLWPQGDIVYLNAPVRRPMSRRGGVIRLGRLDVEAYRFPRDRRLRGLRGFTRQESASSVWQQWLDRSEAQERIAPETLQRFLLRYVPEQKCVVRLRAETVPRDGHKRRITVRSATPAVCATLLKRHEDLRRWAKSAKGPLHATRIVGHDPHLGLLAVKWAQGKHLVDRLTESDPVEVLKDLAGVIRSFHAAPVRDLPTVHGSALLSQAFEAINDLSSTCPDLRRRIEAMPHRLRAGLQGLDGVDPVTLHNDLHWNQVRIDGHRYTLLDLERMAQGDPLIDVANLVTQVRMLAHRSEFSVDPGTARRWADEFVEQWQLLSGQAIDGARSRCYTVLSLLRLARGMMRHLRPGWRELARACIEEAERELYAPSLG